MELWIRVQKNKELKQGLVKVEDLIVDKYSDGKWCIYQSCDTLAIYKTEKRALEVIDEIQNVIKLKQSWQLNENSFKVCIQKYGYDEEQVMKIMDKMFVYEMPKE